MEKASRLLGGENQDALHRNIIIGRFSYVSRTQKRSYISYIPSNIVGGSRGTTAGLEDRRCKKKKNIACHKRRITIMVAYWHLQGSGHSRKSTLSMLASGRRSQFNNERSFWRPGGRMGLFKDN